MRMSVCPRVLKLLSLHICGVRSPSHDMAATVSVRPVILCHLPWYLPWGWRSNFNTRSAAAVPRRLGKPHTQCWRLWIDQVLNIIIISYFERKTLIQVKKKNLLSRLSCSSSILHHSPFLPLPFPQVPFPTVARHSQDMVRKKILEHCVPLNSWSPPGALISSHLAQTNVCSVLGSVIFTTGGQTRVPKAASRGRGVQDPGPDELGVGQ